MSNTNELDDIFQDLDRYLNVDHDTVSRKAIIAFTLVFKKEWDPTRDIREVFEEATELEISQLEALLADLKREMELKHPILAKIIKQEKEDGE